MRGKKEMMKGEMERKRKQAVNLEVGSEVEVSSEEEGLRGAWYVATVLKPPPSSSSSSLKSGKLLVEYQSLLAHENGTALLRELVDPKFVRPLPPADPSPVRFRPNDLVDAYYQDGWWCGVVTQLVDASDSLYKVFFSNPPDEILFHSSLLRPHRRWLYGSWILPPQPNPQTLGELNLSPGAAVEVNLDADDSQDAWFPATVVKQVSSTIFLVEYQSSELSGLRKVGVDSLHIRPPPPLTPTPTFSLLDKVDAFCDSCWLTGIVTKILAAGRFIVYFKGIQKEKELSLTDMRPHLEWTNGKWLHSSHDTSLASKSEKQSLHLNSSNQDNRRTFSEDSVVMKESNGHVRISAARLCEKDPQTTVRSGRANCISTRPINERSKQIDANDNTIATRRSRRSNEGIVSDAMISSLTCKRNTKKTEVFNCGTSLAHDNPMADQAKLSSKQSEDGNQSSGPTDIKADHEKVAVARKRGNPPQLRAQVVVSGNFQLEAHAEPVLERSTKSYSLNPLAPVEPIVIELTHDSSGPLLKKKTICEGKQLDALADHETLAEPDKAGEMKSVKRKRGRPNALRQLGSPKTTTEAENVETLRRDVYAEGSPVTPILTDDVKNPVAISKSLQTSVPSGPPANILRINSDLSKQVRLKSRRSTTRRQIEKQRKVPIEADMEPDNTLILRGKKLKSIKQAELAAEGIEKDNLRGEAVGDAGNVVNTAADVTSGNAFEDDQPLSAWLEAAHSPPATDGRGSVDVIADPSGETEYETLPGGQPQENESEECEKMLGRHRKRDNDSSKSEDETAAIECNRIVGREEELPFIKRSAIWEVIEGMEILKKVPQKPHFRPLYNCKEECREGLAIGRMVTFTSIAEKISRAHIEEEERVLEGYGEALGELEDDGFEVMGVRESLEKLICIKRRHEEGEKRREEIERQIREREEERGKIEEEIREVEKEMEEARKKQRRMEWRKEKEMRVVEASVEAVKGAQEEFDKLAASLF